MFTTFSLYNSFASLVNTQQGSWFRPQTDFEVQANDVSTEIWDMLTKKAEKSQQEKDYLRPFLKSKQGIVKNQNTFYGLLDFPDQYERFSSARIIVHDNITMSDKQVDGGKCFNGEFTQEQINEEYYNNIEEIQIDLIDDKNWAACLQHLTKKPTLKKPKMLEINGQFRVAPRTVSVVILDYYVKPKYATFKYTVTSPNIQTGAGDDIVYDTSSQQFEWPESVRPEFIWRLATRYGFFVDKEFVANFANTQRQMNPI
jgi:hypothetical protein